MIQTQAPRSSPTAHSGGSRFFFSVMLTIGLIIQGLLSIAAPAREAEKIGPSSRRSALSISEILYHPMERADGLDAEFVELYNSQLWAEDISGFRLAGGIQYRFPEGSVIPPKAFIVVAKSPSALSRIYGLEAPQKALGPFDGKLNNQGDKVQLLNRQGAVMIDISYESHDPWPLAAAGAGSSLALTHPSYGEGSPKAWSASRSLGGSPGHNEVQAHPEPIPVHINEVWRHPSHPDTSFIELSYDGDSSYELSNAKFVVEPVGSAHSFPAKIVLTPNTFHTVELSKSELDLSKQTGTLYLIDTANQRVIDAFPLSPHDPSMSLSRNSPGITRAVIVNAPTPGAENAPMLEPDIIINEIMYHPIAGRNGTEYIELFNRSAQDLDLSHWEISGDVQFKFPDRTRLPSQAYLVIAKNIEQLRTYHPQLSAANSLGNFRGQLSNSGGTLTLSRPIVWNTPQIAGDEEHSLALQEVDRVPFFDRSRWSQWADGGGSSLELKNPFSDNSRAGNWADSDESSKAEWSTVEQTKSLNRSAGTRPRSFQILLLGAGECLVDDVTLARPGSENQIKNPDFESSPSSWVFQGNHERSAIEEALGINGSQALKVVGSQRGDPHTNRIRTTLNRGDLLAPNEASLSARVRWQRGFPEILFRLQSNFVEFFHRMKIPYNLGTPGLRNSRWEANPAPIIQDVTHHPVIPNENQAIVVTALVQDETQLESVRLNYRIDLTGEEWRSTEMNDDGSEADQRANDGIFTATLPGQTPRTTLLFSIEASDRAQPSQRSTFPLDAEKHQCLIRVGDSSPENGLGVYRLWISNETQSEWSSSNRPNTSNEPLDATFIYNDERVIYNVGAAYSGSFFNSPRYSSPTGTPCDYSIRFRNDEPFLGASKAIISWPGLTGTPDTTLQREQFSYWIADQLGLPSNYRRYVTMFVNGTQRNTVMEDTQRPNQDMVKQWYPEDNKGHLHKIQLRYESDDSATAITAGLNSATLERKENPDGTIRTAAYRWNWASRSDAQTANNFEPLFELIEAVNTSDRTLYQDRVTAVADIDQWMRTFAVEHIVGNWDSYGYGNGQNMYAYKPNNGKWQLMIWDLDIGNGSGESARTSLFKLTNPFFPNVNGDTVIVREMFRTPEFERAYWRALRDAATGPMEATRANHFLNTRFEALRTAIGRSRPASPSSISRYTEQRRDYILGQLDRIKTEFALMDPQEVQITTEHNPVTLQGTAPINVTSIRINGIEHQPNWLDTTEWELSLPLTGYQNNLVLEAVTAPLTEIDYPPISVSIAYTGTPDRLPPQILISEWMAVNQSTIADPADGEFEDWIELHNLAETGIDLEGFTLTDDLRSPSKWTFPAGTTIAPKGYLLIWADAEPEQNIMNDSLHLNFRLNREGEQLALFTADGRLTDSIQFGRQEADESEGRTIASQQPTRQSTPSPGQANTDQTIPTQPFRITHIEILAPDTIRLEWDAPTNTPVKLQSKQTFDSESPWIDLSSPLQGTTIEIGIESSQTFYRIVQP